MILDARTLENNTLIAADVCIAGAGAAGITLARELRHSGFRVVVLESGDLRPSQATQDLYAGSVDGIDYSLTESRLRYFGGSTNHWSGWCRPLDPEDFATRSWLPRSGWPLTREELEPFYLRAQSICQIGEPLGFDADRIASLVGKPLLPFDPERVQTIVYFLSPPTRFGTLYRDELASAGNVIVYLNANLVNIRLAPMGGAVESFECATLSRVSFRVLAARYVLALGGIENARALLASNGQEPAGVGNQNDLVGRFFMEHPQSATSWSAFILASSEMDLAFYTTTWLLSDVSSVPAIRLAPQLRAKEGLAGMAVFLGEVEFREAAPFMGEFPAERLWALLRSANPPRLLSASLRAEQPPLPDSRVTLRSDRDALGIPRVNLHWSISLSDVAGMRRSLELVASEIGRIGLGRLWMPLDASGEFRTELEGAAHHMGTTRMGVSPTEGVVDSNCRVHGLANLYVAGSSVFPTGGFANPTLTIVALALRLAEHLERAP